MLSSITKKIKHPAYQEIIAMGEKVLPWILQELQREPSHWFSALSAIAKVDPVSADDNFEQAVEAWLNWGKSQGYIQSRFPSPPESHGLHSLEFPPCDRYLTRW